VLLEVVAPALLESGCVELEDTGDRRGLAAIREDLAKLARRTVLINTENSESPPPCLMLDGGATNSDLDMRCCRSISFPKLPCCYSAEPAPLNIRPSSLIRRRIFLKDPYEVSFAVRVRQHAISVITFRQNLIANRRWKHPFFDLPGEGSGPEGGTLREVHRRTSAATL
jgi:hypothetical protein